MNNAQFIKLLNYLEPDERFICHVQHTGYGLAETWEKHDLGSDMAWLLAHLADRRTLARVLAAVVRPVLVNVPVGEKRPRICVETLERWSRGEATDEELRKAADAVANAAYYAVGTAYAANAAARAAYAVVNAAGAASAAKASANAADTACATSYAAMRTAGIPRFAAIIRNHIPAAEIVRLAKQYTK